MLIKVWHDFVRSNNSFFSWTWDYSTVYFGHFRLTFEFPERESLVNCYNRLFRWWKILFWSNQLMSRLSMLDIFCWHSAQLSCLQLKGSTSRLKHSVKNLIWSHPRQSQRFGFSVFTSLLANNISDREWIMCLWIKWLLWQAALFLNFLFNV